MATKIERYVELKDQLKSINKFIKDESYIGAGLTIDLSLGASTNSKYIENIQMHGTPDKHGDCLAMMLLDVLRKSIIQSIADYEYYLKSEYDEIKSLLKL